MQQSKANLAAAVIGVTLLEALTAEHVGRIEVSVGVLGAADPAKLILALATGQVVATLGLFLDYQSALRAVGHLFGNAIDGEVLLHGCVQLAAAVALRVVGQAAPDTDLVLTCLTNAMIGVPPIEPVRLHFEAFRLKAF